MKPKNLRKGEILTREDWKSLFDFHIPCVLFLDVNHKESVTARTLMLRPVLLKADVRTTTKYAGHFSRQRTSCPQSVSKSNNQEL